MQDATAFLKSLRPAAGAALPIAISAGVTRGTLVVAFAWTLSGIVNDAVFGGADLVALAGRIEFLIALTLLRAALGWIADQAAFRASAQVRKTLFREMLDHVRELGPVRLIDAPTGELVTVFSDAVTAIEPYWRRYHSGSGDQRRHSLGHSGRRSAVRLDDGDDFRRHSAAACAFPALRWTRR